MCARVLPHALVPCRGCPATRRQLERGAGEWPQGRAPRLLGVVPDVLLPLAGAYALARLGGSVLLVLPLLCFLVAPRG